MQRPGEHVSEYLSAEQIAARVASLARDIEAAGPYDRPLVMICVLKGSILFFADLARQLQAEQNLVFLGVSSYNGGTSTSGAVRLTHDLTLDIADRDVLIVEDIVDTGLTIAHLLDLFRTRKPASLKVCALLHKPSRTRIEVPIDYLGFTIEDKFVVGYGLDFAQRYRNLPFIGIVEHA
jgi:hypoxanthine phosphoribosyltransferase